MRRVASLLLSLGFLFWLIPGKAFAQFYGAAGVGITSSSNVSGLDSSMPDVILDPNILVGYDWNIDHRFRLGFSAGASLNEYTTNTERSSSNIFFGVTPTYYLLSNSTFFATVTDKDTANVESSTAVGSVSDRLLKLENWLITVRPKLPKLKGTIDSSQELIGVTRELLSTTAYTTSVKEIVISELRDQLARIEAHHSRELSNITKEWKALIDKLESIEEESDFLPTDELDIDEAEEEELVTAVATASKQLAPLTTMSTTHQRFRSMGASDFYLLQDRGTLSERTIATTLSLPVSWSKQTNSETYENYSNEQLWISLRASGMPSNNLQLAGNIDHIRTDHPFDEVYTNNEWRLRGTGKLVIGDRTLLAGELGYGNRVYSHPLSFSVGPNQKRQTVVTVGADFSQVNVGAWLEHFVSEKLVLGAIVAAAISPELKAYVTSINRSFSDQGPNGSLGVADEEYNYDLVSLSGFVNSNPFEEIEATLDLSYQNRSYGAVDLGTIRTNEAGSKEIRDLVASSANAQRTENWIVASLSASRLFLFDNRLLSAFSGIGVEATITHTSVSASVSTYSNSNTSFSLSAAAYF